MENVTLRFSYIALKSSDYAKGFKGIIKALFLNPSIVFNYQKIHHAKQKISEHVIKEFS